MNDKYTEALEQYDMEVLSVRRGRGSWICETDQGWRLLKEYRGTVKRLEFEDQVLSMLDPRTSLRADRYVRNKEGALFTAAGDGTCYIVKEWFLDRECSLKDGFEIRQALSRLAMLHRQLREIPFREEWRMGSTGEQPLTEEMERHNREMQRVRNYIRGKRKKSELEMCVICSFDTFFDQAREALKGMERLWAGSTGTNASQGTGMQDWEGRERLKAAELEPMSQTGISRTSCDFESARPTPSDSSDRPLYLCHGDLDQHHVLMGGRYTAIIDYNRMHLGIQVSDLYRFMRKAMEKHGWNADLGLSMLESYERVLPMEKKELACLYYLFLYPEKYWKQLNFYYNSNKAWIPVRNIDKLRVLEAQQPARNAFLKRLEWDIQRV